MNYGLAAAEAPQFQCNSVTCTGLNTEARSQAIALAMGINVAARTLGLKARAPEAGDVGVATLTAAQAVADAEPVLPENAPADVRKLLGALRAREITLQALANNASEATMAFFYVDAHATPSTTASSAKRKGSGAAFATVAVIVAAIVIVAGLAITLSDSGARCRELES